MVRAKTQKIILDSHGSYLGMEKGCFTVKDKEGNVKRFPLFEKEIGEVVLKSGNMVSTSALASLGFWDVDVLIMTQRGRPVAMLKALDDDSHVKTRVCQYEATKNGKSVEIAKKIVLARIEDQNQVLKKYGLRQHDLMKAREIIRNIPSEKLAAVRKALLSVEGKFTEHYFHQIFHLLPKSVMIEKR